VWLQKLTSLKHLYVGDANPGAQNRFAGSIDVLGKITSLTTLYMGSNGASGRPLNGTIDALASLTLLTELILTINSFTGTLDAMAHLTSLVSLRLDGNVLTGSLEPLAQLKSLAQLALDDNQLTGTLDPIAQLTSLHGFALGGNLLRGSIQPLAMLTSVNFAGLDGNLLYGNQFTGPIDVIGKLTNLGYLNIDGNQFTGTIPTDIGMLTSLTTLGLAGANCSAGRTARQLHGSIDAIKSLTKLNSLHLNCNQFTGPVDAVYNMRQLRGLNLANNSFTGIIGDGFRAQTMPNLTFIDLSVNNFTAVPSNIVDWSRFTDHCDLHHEAFTCSTAMAIPAQAKAHCGATCCVGSSADLVGGDCDAWQKFTRDPVYTKWAEGKCGAKVHTDPCSCSAAGSGGVWHVECADGRIDYIKMDNSGLPRGVVPMALLDLTGLKTLQLGGNGLSSTIPSAIGQLQQLESLILWQNDLHGAIPHELTTLSHLNTILFNSKHLTGVLPAFNFSQLATCVMAGPIFTCPLPPGAETCVGNAEIPSVGKWPPPHCQ
jgi:Leucine-rich repeat (LRR) protein